MSLKRAYKRIPSPLRTMMPKKIVKIVKRFLRAGKISKSKKIVKWQKTLDDAAGAVPAKLYLKLGQAYCDTGRLAEAEKVLQEGVGRYGDNRKLKRAFAELAMAGNNWVEAAHRWEWLIDSADSDISPKYYLSASKAFFRVEDYDKASHCLDKVLSECPENREAKLELRNQCYKAAFTQWRMEVGRGVNVPANTHSANTGENWAMVAARCEESLQEINGPIQYQKAMMEYIQAQLILSEHLWVQNKPAAAQNTINHTLAVSLGKTAPELTEVISTAVGTARSGEEGPGRQKDIKEQINSYNASDFSSTQWLNIYDILMWNGLFQSGFAARQKAVEQVYQAADKRTATADELINAIKAAIEAADFGRVEGYLSKLAAFGTNKELARIKAYYELLSGDVAASVAMFQQSYGAVDQKYHEYIQGKSVAIVGPAPSGELSGEEIDSYDVVIRLNYSGADNIPNPAEFGTKTNVSYYSQEGMRFYVMQNKFSHLQDLDFYVFRSLKFDFLQSTFNKGLAKELYKVRNFFYKRPNAVPATLYDILHYNPAKVKLFQTNFFLSAEPYASGYRKSEKNENRGNKISSLHNLLATHDLLSQRAFVHNLLAGGVISADKKCSEVLNLSDEQYIIGMEKLYGYFH